MGKLEEKQNGLYVLESVKIGVLTLPNKYFKEVEPENINDVLEATEPKLNGFYLDIPDR